jgi:hypothetical protein
LIAAAIIDHYPRFEPLRETDFHEVRIRYLWALGEKKSAGKIDLGWCQKANPILRWATGFDYVIGIQVEALRLRSFTNLQLEALLFHELCHIEVEIDKGEMKRRVIGHDQEIFHDEIRHYGLWKPSLEPTYEAFKQMPLTSVVAHADKKGREAIAEIDRLRAKVKPTTPQPPSSPLPEIKQFRDSMQRMADEDGVTLTLSTPGQTVTIGPKKRIVDGETFELDDMGRYVNAETGEYLDPADVVSLKTAGGR